MRREWNKFTKEDFKKYYEENFSKFENVIQDYTAFYKEIKKRGLVNKVLNKK